MLLDVTLPTRIAGNCRPPILENIHLRLRSILQIIRFMVIIEEDDRTLFTHLTVTSSDSIKAICEFKGIMNFPFSSELP